jgi:hypothetical protein
MTVHCISNDSVKNLFSTYHSTRFSGDINTLLKSISHFRTVDEIRNWPLWSWSYGSCLYNYLCNQCLSPLTLGDRISLKRGVLDTTLCDKVYQWLAVDRWFSPGTPDSSINKTDRHSIAEILLKVASNTINHTSMSTEYNR